MNGTVPASGFWEGRNRGRHINYLELAAVFNTLNTFEPQLRGKNVLLWEDNMTVVHVLTNRTTRSPELMRLLRRVWFLLDTVGVSLEVKYIASGDNHLADALSRGSPFDELMLRASAWTTLQRRFGPHTVDRFASKANALLPRYNALLPDGSCEGALALAQSWTDENNYAFPPVAELPRLAQLLAEAPPSAPVVATVVTPYWPASAWWQLLTEQAASCELHRLYDLATAPASLPASALHALSGATLAVFRVGPQGGSTGRQQAA